MKVGGLEHVFYEFQSFVHLEYQIRMFVVRLYVLEIQNLLCSIESQLLLYLSLVL